MAAAAQYRTEHLATAPRGWRVRMKAPGPRSSHLIAVAFPPGRRKKGSGKLIEILHPKDEAKNPACEVSKKAKSNPTELLIFGNPATDAQDQQTREIFKRGREEMGRRYAAEIAELRQAVQDESDAEKKTKLRSLLAKFGAKRFIHNPTGERLKALRAARERAAKIRGARLNSGTKNHKAGCPCFACKHQRAIAKADRRMPKPVRDVMRANPRRRRKDRKNPSETEQAVRLFETFHGRDASKIIEKHVSAAQRKDYTALGNLVYLEVITPIGEKVHFDFEDDGVMLASSPDGKQLYCIGGRQNLLHCLDEESQQKDFIDVGECQEVAYLARKIHSNYEPIEWFHKFGEKTGVRPQLMFDKLKRQIFFVGGEYFIDPKVDLSPGIEN